MRRAATAHQPRTGRMTGIRRWCRREDGNATIEFVILFPMFMILLISSVEMGMITLRHTLMDRAIDLTVRDIRLSTGQSPAPQHDEIRDLICERAAIIPECTLNLKVEMIRMDLRAWADPPARFDCVDREQPVQPVSQFVNGSENEMMLIRICAMFKPVFPLAGLGRDLQTDAAGYVAMVSSTAFVQEPL